MQNKFLLSSYAPYIIEFTKKHRTAFAIKKFIIDYVQVSFMRLFKFCCSFTSYLFTLALNSMNILILKKTTPNTVINGIAFESANVITNTEKMHGI